MIPYQNTAKGRRLLSVGVSEREVRLASAQSTTSLKSQISVHSVPRFVKAIKFQSKILWQHNFIHTILLERKNWYLPCTAKGRHLLSVRGEYVCGGRVRQKTLRTIILFLSSCVSLYYVLINFIILINENKWIVRVRVLANTHKRSYWFCVFVFCFARSSSVLVVDNHDDAVCTST